MCLIAYAGFLRFSELINFKRSNICIFNSHVSLVIERSKTDTYKEGSTVVISRTPNDTCPVTMLERYLHRASILPSSSEFIFRSIIFCKKSKTYKLKSVNNLRDIIHYSSNKNIGYVWRGIKANLWSKNSTAPV